MAYSSCDGSDRGVLHKSQRRTKKATPAEWRNKCKGDHRSLRPSSCSCEGKPESLRPAWIRTMTSISCVFVFISSLSTWFKYMKCMNVYHFILIFPGPYITSHFNDQLLVGLVAQLIRALQRSAVRIRIPASWIFFTLSFCTCISFVVIFFTFF